MHRTLQEGLAASNSSVVICGRDEILWTRVLEGLKNRSQEQGYSDMRRPVAAPLVSIPAIRPGV
jgi:hypothetical protein